MKRRDERLCPLHRAGSVRRAAPSGSIEFRRQRLVAQALVVPLDGGGELSLAVGSRLFVELAGAQFGEKPGLFHGPLETAQRHLEGFVFLDAYGRHAVFIPEQCCSKGANSRLFLAETPAACVPYPPSLPVSPRIRNSCPTVAARRSTSVRRASRGGSALRERVHQAPQLHVSLRFDRLTASLRGAKIRCGLGNQAATSVGQRDLGGQTDKIGGAERLAGPCPAQAEHRHRPTF